MDPRFDALIATFGRAEEAPPCDLASALEGLPGPGSLPSPWEVWTLIGLIRHRERQIWVMEIIRTRLRGSPTGLARLGAMGHPDDIPGSGSVPGMPEWEYYFHGRGCCISHKVDGDAIDVDFWDDTADYFDTWFYRNYLESLQRPESPERRLRELHGSSDAISIAIDDLLAVGMLVGPPERGYRLSEGAVACTGAVDAFCRAWDDLGRRAWLAALIGDWIEAHEVVIGRPELERIAGARAERCRELRRRRLHRMLRRGKAPISGGMGREGDAMRALADLGGPGLVRSIKEALGRPSSGLTSAALEIIGRQDDPRWCRHVYALLARVDPIEDSYIWIKSLKFLFRHSYRIEALLDALPNTRGAVIGEGIMLALEHAPRLALPLIRSGLLETVPAGRTEAAAILALFLPRPWSRRELLAALEASDDHERTVDIRSVLLESDDEEAQNAVLAWEARNPREAEVGSYVEVDGRLLGPSYSLREHLLKNRYIWIQYEMEQFHDRVMKVRDVIPPEPFSDQHSA